MILIKSRDEIERIRESNRIVAQALQHVGSIIEPGISTAEIDREVESFILAKNAKPAFKGLYGFPASTCISIDDEVVHGIPSKKRKLKPGQIVGIDIGVEYRKYFGDAAFTFVIGKISAERQQLLKVTEESLYLGIDQAVIGNRVGDISHAVQSHVERHGFSVVRDLVGHGVGIKPHEDPQIPNFGPAGKGPRLREGMILAIEPMVNMGTHEVYFADDEWTVKTRDGMPSAHFEHSIAITRNGPDILSALDGE